MVERQRHPSNRTRPLRPADGFELARLSEEGGDYDVAPAECKSLAELRFEEDPPNLEDEPENQDPSPHGPPPRFTVLELMIFMTFAGIGLGAVRWLPSGYFAGVASLLATVALLVGNVWKPRNILARWMIWGVVTIYFAAALGAALLHWQGETRDVGPPEERNARTGQR